MVEKRVNKFGQGPPPPLFGQCPKEIDFSSVRCSLKHFLLDCKLYDDALVVFEMVVDEKDDRKVHKVGELVTS